MTRLMVRVTNRCQMECRHCLSSSSPTEKTTNNMMNIFYEIDKIEGGKIDDLLFSGGECFLEPEKIEKTIKYVIDCGIKIMELSFMTNGLNFKKNAHFISELVCKFKLESTKIDIRVSHSKFHREQGVIDISEIKMVCRSYDYFLTVSNFSKNKKLYPQGRAYENRVELQREGFTFLSDKICESYTRSATVETHEQYK